MNKTELAEMARKAGFEVSEITGAIRSPSPLCGTELKRFAKLVAAAEREACAKVCEGIHAEYEADRIMGHDDEATEWRERWKHLFGVAGSATSPWRESAAQGCSPGGTGMPATPPQRKPLTSDKDRPDQGATYVEGYGYVDTRAVRAVERAHEIGSQA